jgi:quercetin dioxygenase-like cupin family protein
MKALLLGVMMLTGSFVFAQHQQHHGDSAMKQSGGHVMLNDANIKWMPGPPFLPAGVQLAVLEGDPSKEGPFTVRLMMPANYTIPPHTHPTAEHVTVIEGNLYMGTTSMINRNGAMQLRKGGYAIMPANFTHYAFSRGKTIVQVHGVGPFAINYIKPADDPRNRK